MNSGPLARFACLEVTQKRAKSRTAPIAFKTASNSISGLMARVAATGASLDLPFDEAIAYFRQKVSIPTQSWRDVWDAAHSKMLMVAGANTVALVDDFRESIEKALTQGTTLEEFRKDFDQIVKTHGWSYKGERGWRTRTIFETNLATAYAAGRYAQMTEPDTLATFPYWQYRHSGALHPRLQHKAWDEKIYPADDPFWVTAYPPNGFRCGCFVIPISRARLRRMGKSGPDRAPDLDQLGTDQPLGVDPSFAYNPGMAWLKQTAPGPKAVSATEANVAAFVRSALKGKWPDGSWTPVAVVEDGLDIAAVKAGDELRLTADRIRTDAGKSEADVFATIPRRLLKKGARIRTAEDGTVTVTGRVDGGAWTMAVRPIADGDRRWLDLVSLKKARR